MNMCLDSTDSFAKVIFSTSCLKEWLTFLRGLTTKFLMLLKSLIQSMISLTELFSEMTFSGKIGKTPLIQSYATH